MDTREGERMSDLMNELIQLAERLVELTSDQPVINDLIKMEEESKWEKY